MNFRAWTILLLAGSLFVAGCDEAGVSAAPEPPGPADRSAGALMRERARVYPEAAGGRVAVLADFEDVVGCEQAGRQAERFSISPDLPEASRRLVDDKVRTGAGAMEVTVPAGGQLVFDVPAGVDFGRYKLLSLALHSRALRDDLQVAIEGDTGEWKSHRCLIRPGWNNVLLDIRRLGQVGGVDPASVRRVRLWFPDAAGAVWFHLDDLMLIDNTRAIEPVPLNIELTKSGLDYTLRLAGNREPVKIERGDDGFWRMGRLQAQLRLAEPGESLADSGEDLELMGDRRLGQLELLEHNAIRIRLASTWYFPSRSGQWASMAVRQIRREYTIYADGLCVVRGVLNNAGGREVGAIGIHTPTAAFHGGLTGREHLVGEFAGEAGRWRYLLVPPGKAGAMAAESYLRPGRLRPTIARGGVSPAGDSDRDGFDESHGCYHIAARGGQCRFVLVPPPGGVVDPVFVVAGDFSGSVNVSSEGKAIRPVVIRPDGSVLFRLGGCVSRPTAIEVFGRQASRSR